MKLSVIIVNYNVRYFLEQALLAVRRAAKRLPTEVIVVDNNSVDDSVAMVREKFPEVQLICNQDNPGFAIANNQAIQLANGEYVLLLNPDTVVEEDTFERCANFMDQRPQAGGLGVRMIDGGGRFLPESKRGFPTPMVAFWKSFGMSRLFPKSRVFNRYHLGYLAEDEVHEVEVLSGAFMWLRRSVLDEIGVLDENFFMYGEDIDLSYRIVLAGYKNFYFPETTIIHYKGESTKKGSLNYVKTFYQAMIIFARKHFQGGQAKLFVGMLQVAIYLRAALTLVANVMRRLLLPLADATLLYVGLIFLKNFWANYHFHTSDYYPSEILYFNFPLYILIWLGGVFFSGGYDQPFDLRRLFRGLLAGTVLLAAIYGFLDLEYRSSRALIVLGAAWAMLMTFLLRLSIYFYRYRSLALGRANDHRLVVVGSLGEMDRALRLLQRASVSNNFIGRIRTGDDEAVDSIGRIDQLEEICRIYRVNEIIFCSRDVSSQAIMRWMSKLGSKTMFKILPEDSVSIIGSHSKNTSGELYTIDVQFDIDQPLERRNKRIFDLLLALFLLISLPLQLLLIKRPWRFLSNWSKVVVGHYSWVGYSAGLSQPHLLPQLRPGILSPLDAQELAIEDPATLQHLNLLYAKDYRLWTDLQIVWRAWRDLGR